MKNKKTVALVAHDSRKQDLSAWANYNREALSKYNLVGTSGTAQLLHDISGLMVHSLGHGPDGGDIIIAKEILDEKIDKLIFLIDVKTPLGHETEIQMLIRTAVLKNIPLALNRNSADFLIKGMESTYID